MHNGLKTMSNVFYVCAGAFLALGIVIICHVEHFELWLSFDKYAFESLCVLLYTLAVPGIFLGLGIAMNKINHALFDETLSRINQSTNTNKD